MTLRLVTDALRRLPGVTWLAAWTDPWHLTTRRLREMIVERGEYVRGCVLDVGCGTKPYRDLFQWPQYYVGLDISTYPGSKADVVASAFTQPFLEQAFDAAVCTDVLEHVREPSMLMSAIARVLKAGGYVLLTIPFTWDIHYNNGKRRAADGQSRHSLPSTITIGTRRTGSSTSSRRAVFRSLTSAQRVGCGRPWHSA